MIPNKIYTYGYTDGKKGLEARYMLTGSTLYVKIPGCDHVYDYTVSITGAIIPIRPFAGSCYLYNRAYWKMAKGFNSCIRDMAYGHDISEIKIMSFSMGGGVAAMLPFFSEFEPSITSITLINTPRVMSFRAVRYLAAHVMRLTVLYVDSDLVHKIPGWFAQYPDQHPYVTQRLPIGEAHNLMPHEWEEFPI